MVPLPRNDSSLIDKQALTNCVETGRTAKHVTQGWGKFKVNKVHIVEAKKPLKIAAAS